MGTNENNLYCCVCNPILGYISVSLLKIGEGHQLVLFYVLTVALIYWSEGPIDFNLRRNGMVEEGPEATNK